MLSSVLYHSKLVIRMSGFWTFGLAKSVIWRGKRHLLLINICEVINFKFDCVTDVEALLFFFFYLGSLIYSMKIKYSQPGTFYIYRCSHMFEGYLNVWFNGDGAFILKSCFRKSSRCCCWQSTGRSDLVAAAVGGRTAVLPLLSFSFVSKFLSVVLSGSDR